MCLYFSQNRKPVRRGDRGWKFKDKQKTTIINMILENNVIALREIGEAWKTSILQTLTRSACPHSTVSWINTSWWWIRYIVVHLSATLTAWRSNSANMCMSVQHPLNTLYRHVYVYLSIHVCRPFDWYAYSPFFREFLNLMPVLYSMNISSLMKQGSTCWREGYHWQPFQCPWTVWQKFHHVCCYWLACHHAQLITIL